MARIDLMHESIMNSKDSFRVLTLDGADSDLDGMRERELDPTSGKYIAADAVENARIYQGYKFGDLPTTYLIGDNATYMQRQAETVVEFKGMLNFDEAYPESEYMLNTTL